MLVLTHLRGLCLLWGVFLWCARRESGVENDTTAEFENNHNIWHAHLHRVRIFSVPLDTTSQLTCTYALPLKVELLYSIFHGYSCQCPCYVYISEGESWRRRANRRESSLSRFLLNMLTTSWTCLYWTPEEGLFPQPYTSERACWLDHIQFNCMGGRQPVRIYTQVWTHIPGIYIHWVHTFS